MKFTKSNITLEELEQYRDENGFIDLDKINLSIDEDSRNQMGTSDILKYWIDFSGKKVLLKEAKQLDGEVNYSVYSELIVTEMARQLGLEVAGCDLIKYNGRIGIISSMAFEYGKETLETTHGVIGETTVYPQFEDLCDYAEVEEKIVYTLVKEWNIPKKEVWNLILERRKQKILQMFVYEADNHLENEGIIIGQRDGMITVKCAPMFDNEQSFLLNYPINDLEGYNNSNKQANRFSRKLRELYKKIRDNNIIRNTIKENVELMRDLSLMEREDISSFLRGNKTFIDYTSGVATRVACLEEATEYPGDTITDRTLAYVIDCDEDEINDFCYNVLDLNMNQVFENIELRIKSSLPNLVKEIVSTIVNYRQIELKAMLRGRDLRQDYDNAAVYLKELAEKYIERGEIDSGEK